jgi:hypothetical protein
MLKLVSAKEACPRCKRTFSRGLSDQVSQLYDQVLSDFEAKMADELKALPVCDRADVLVQFGLKMENARVASVDMLLRALAELLTPQLAGLSRGYEGRISTRRLERGSCAVVDVDAYVEDGTHARRRLRIARIDPNGFIQVDLNQSEAANFGKAIAR